MEALIGAKARDNKQLCLFFPFSQQLLFFSAKRRFLTLVEKKIRHIRSKMRKTEAPGTEG